MGLMPKIPGLDVGAAVAQFRSVMEGIAADTARNQANTQNIAGHLVAINARLDQIAAKLTVIEIWITTELGTNVGQQATVTEQPGATDTGGATIAHINRPAA